MAKKDEISKDDEYLTLGYKGYRSLPYKAMIQLG